ncbi:PepSY domain-containing protein [Paraflavitalea pollutisoli]|uniref:PepSY domain-containing protein n=1 Tax=Paraflavitalea pollutisoli TaxID=3034143 RepID=UPI0023EBC64D|nr:PepSY domain-containing protein [Paraflavitalea sp. H1-2-19X]
MTMSIWRYSHFALAVSSFLLLTLASVTGIILAFEPVTEKVQPYKVSGFYDLHLSQVVPVLKAQYPGLQEIKVDDNEFVLITWSDKTGDNQKAYVHPATGARLGTPHEKPALFQWTTTLHRSLFLHETGRIIMGITAFLLILVTLSGIALVIQRQKGLKRFFHPIEQGNWAQYYHVLFGRFALFPILAVAITGTLLALAQFDSWAPKKTILSVDTDHVAEEPVRKPAEFPLFQRTFLSQVQSVEFPFSDFPEDYYTLKLKDRHVAVNQFTGDVLAQAVLDKTVLLNNWSMRWHTGRNGIIWAIVLAITAGYLLFFIYSGLVITIKRRSGRVRNKYKAADARIILLVGTENGTTNHFAASVYKQLISHGEKVYLAGLDKYTTFPQAQHLIVMTSTYGLGDPPANGKHFAAQLLKHPQAQPIHYSVVGFGSRSYQDFCQFAVDTDHLLQQQSWAQAALPLYTIDDRSPQDFSNWLTAWSQLTGFPLTLPRQLLTTNKHGLRSVKVMHKTAVDANDSFQVRLKLKGLTKVSSGDLLAIYPKNDHRERLYSIGKIGKEIQLSIRLHEHGLGSRYLHGLEPGATLSARIVKNQHFHFPRKARAVLMIANGTGIAPFLGMISSNHKGVPIQLYAGFRTRAAFALYRTFLQGCMDAGKLDDIHLALSRETGKHYVSDLLLRDEEHVFTHLQEGGIVMICGSLSMQRDVLALLEKISVAKKGAGVEAWQSGGQILSDCY